jgi:hypothetical protein
VALSKVFLTNHATTMPKVTVTYFGDQADTVQSFNCYTAKEMVDQTLEYYGAKQVETDGDLNIIVATTASQNTDTMVCQLVSQLNENQQNGIPTILVDMTGGQASSLNSMLIDNVNLGMLLSYSGSNEQPNSVTMALSQGLARYASLTISGFLTEDSQAAHLENLATAYLLEFAYLDGAYSTMNSYLSSQDIPSGNFGTLDSATLNQVEAELTKQVRNAGTDLMENLKNSPYISNLKPYTLSSVGDVSITSCTYPFLRNLEIGCDVTVKLSSKAASLGTFHKKYINGTSSTTFQPNDNVTREQAVTMLLGAMGVTAPVTTVECPDDVDPWAWNNVRYAKEKGYVKGYLDGSYRGKNSITRAEFCSLILQYAEQEHISLSTANNIVFKDVDPNSTIWYVSPIYALASAGLVVGFDGYFRPDDPITRAEAVTVFNRLWGRTEDLTDSLSTTSRFPDVTAPWQLVRVQEASISHFCK